MVMQNRTKIILSILKSKKYPTETLNRGYNYFRPIFLSTTKPWTLDNVTSTISQEVTKPLMGERRQLWNLFLGMENGEHFDNHSLESLPEEDLGTELSKLIGQFDLDVVTIREVVNKALKFSRSGKKGLIDAITEEVANDSPFKIIRSCSTH